MGWVCKEFRVEDLVTISSINDFLFCPRSLYFHSLYMTFAKDTYQDEPQISGEFAHEAIDYNKYSASKKVLQSLPVTSVEYGLTGKIDLYYLGSSLLIERKRKVKHIFPGYRFQLYGQYVCLKEMDYPVNCMEIYSFETNEHFNIMLPTRDELCSLKTIVHNIRHYQPLEDKNQANEMKCARCIYSNLCK